MSIIFTASPPKDCSKRGQNQLFHHIKGNRKLLISLSGLIFSILSIFLLWLLLHPTNPRFYLKDLSALNSTISTAIISKNPNSHASIYYDNLHVYVAYAGVQITPEVVLPPFNQGELDNDIISADLVGPTGMSSASDMAVKLTNLNLKIEGNLRWKVGPWVSGRYKLEVDCMTMLMNRPGQLVSVSSIQGAQCSTNG
jgi:Late embryogenesis abundant protein